MTIPKRRHDDESDHDSPVVPKRAYSGATDAAQPLRRSLRARRSLLQKRELEEAESDPPGKRMRILPAEQELMQMDAVSLARKMCS